MTGHGPTRSRLQLSRKFVKGILLLRIRRVFCSACCDRIRGEFREMRVRIIELQRILKTLLQALEEIQRTAEEHDLAICRPCARPVSVWLTTA